MTRRRRALVCVYMYRYVHTSTHAQEEEGIKTIVKRRCDVTVYGGWLVGGEDGCDSINILVYIYNWILGFFYTHTHNQLFSLFLFFCPFSGVFLPGCCFFLKKTLALVLKHNT